MQRTRNHDSAVGEPISQSIVPRTWPSIWTNAPSSYALWQSSLRSLTEGTRSLASSNLAANQSETHPTS